jgi:subtilisin family serine protease
MQEGNYFGSQPPVVVKKKSRSKLILIILIICLLVGALAYFVGYPAYRYFKDGINLYSSSDAPPKVARDHDHIDYDEFSGELYVNDEIILIAYEGVSLREIEALATQHRAKVEQAMEEIGFYKLRLVSPVSYRTLMDLAARMQEEPIVEEAVLNYVSEIDTDTTEPAIPQVLDERAPLYPGDPWSNSSWDMDVPRGHNWGAEAVRAPAAWAYGDYLKPVNVGLIDTFPDLSHEDLEIEAYVAVTGDKTKYQRVTEMGKIKADMHGTHVGGTIGASWNSRGVSGIAGEKARLFYASAASPRDYKKGKVSSPLAVYDYIAAIQALVRQDVRVINISLNTSRLIGFAACRGNKKAIDHLEERARIVSIGLRRMIGTGNDFVICVAAGNNNNLSYYKARLAKYGYRSFALWPEFIVKPDRGDVDAKYNNFISLIEDEDVKGRIVVVGSVGINHKSSTDKETRYSYSSFSNIGPRVDVVGPGEDILSAVAGNRYTTLSGTSMATPHVTGVCGLVYAANPDLSAEEVKAIVLASTSGRWNYTGGYSGMVDAESAVVKALSTHHQAVNKVVRNDQGSGSLDLCFVIDTTGSMMDDMDNVKQNMVRILGEIGEKTDDYRIALIDYRDFPERTGAKSDYPSDIKLEFSRDDSTILEAINRLELGYGGDDPETVYSGLMAAVGLKWRPEATKVISVIGDAPPLDPEPYTGYTKDSVMTALYKADIRIDIDTSDARVLGAGEDSAIHVHSIGTDASYDAVDFFQELSDTTGGTFVNVGDASEVSDAIIDSIEQVDLREQYTYFTDFGPSLSYETVELHSDEGYLFEIKLDDQGTAQLDDMEPGHYSVLISRLGMSGVLDLTASGQFVTAGMEKADLLKKLSILWIRHWPVILLIGAGLVLLGVLTVLIIRSLARRGRRRREKEAAMAQAYYQYYGASAYAQPAPAVAPVASPTPGFCIHCGQALAPSDRFCNRCGKDRGR